MVCFVLTSEGAVVLPADCRGLAGWGRLDLFSDAVSMS